MKKTKCRYFLHDLDNLKKISSIKEKREKSVVIIIYM